MSIEEGIREDEAIIVGAVFGASAVIQYKTYKLPYVNSTELISLFFYGGLAVIGYLYDSLAGDALLGFGLGGVLAVVI